MIIIQHYIINYYKNNKIFSKYLLTKTWVRAIIKTVKKETQMHSTKARRDVMTYKTRRMCLKDTSTILKGAARLRSDKAK